MITRKIIPIMIFLVLLGPGAMAQISPGELAGPHAHLEGISNCTKCHILGQKVSNDKCLDCHSELKMRIDRQKGYHSSSEVRGRECVSCHSDHHGRNFEMIRFDEKAFDHKLAGYELVGAHLEQECQGCHKKDFIAEQKIKDKKYTYLGLGTDCLSCHKDYHQKTMSSLCADCHDQTKFKPAKYFDHSKAEFTLKGRHADVECVKCHKIETRNGQAFQVFADVPFDNCTRCHQDVHDNRFGQNCRQCHTEESFSAIKGISGFDHSRTGFLLEGKHIYVACSACHKSRYTEPVKHERCADCHTDYHEGQFSRQEMTTDCSSCHDAQGFSMTSYTIERHNAGDFRLEGAHLATPCFACHNKKDKWNFRDIGVRCADCHPDIHKDFLDEKYYPDAECTACHTVNAWRDITFDHSLTSWELRGAHEKQPCRSCHFPETSPGKVLQRFSNMGNDCITCHADVHAGQFMKEGKTDCLRCHGPDNWRAIVFDHNTSRFILDGKHKEVACVKCHIEVKDGGISYTKYKFNDISCEACH